MKTITTLLLLITGAVYGQTKDTTKSNLFATFTKIRPQEIRIMSGHELVAYRKPDSAWVLINPDKTRIVLDSIARQYYLTTPPGNK